MSDPSYFQLYLKKGLSQSLFILLIAVLIGFFINWLRPAQMGFPNTRVLVNGWTVWKKMNLPVEGEAFE